MGRRKKPPLLRRSPLTGQVYIITRYTEKTSNDAKPYIVAQEKWDVTSEYEMLKAQEDLGFVEQEGES